MQEQWERAIERSLRECGIEVGEGAVGRLSRYLELVAQWNPKMRLVGSAEVETLARRHVAESLYLSRLVKLEGQSVVDVGSGAGFPGMALQLAYPELKVTMVEVNGKKVAFLKTVARTLGLGRVLQARLEDVDVTGEIVTARALERMEEEGPGRFSRLAAAGGLVALWIGEGTAQKWEAEWTEWKWMGRTGLPGSERRTITLARPPEAA